MLHPVARRWALLALIPLVAVALPAPSHAAAAPNTIVVDTSIDTDVDDGHCSLREAVRNAVGNLRVHSSTGECGVGRADTEDVVRWGFADPFSSLSSPLPTITGADPLRLAGEPGISAPNPIVHGGGATSLLVVDGGNLTLEKITLAGAAGGAGTALDILDGEVSLLGSSIAASSGTGPGAVVRAAAGTTLTLTSSVLVSNTVSGEGGTVLRTAGTLTATDVILTLTQAGGADAAGGISAEGAAVTLTDVELSDNAGTGLSFTGGTTADLLRVDLIRNVTPASCGGVLSSESTLGWTSGEVFGNEAGTDGGGVCLVSSTGAGSSRLSRISITNNHAPSGSGGGLLVRASDVELGNVTVSENTAADGAALAMQPSAAGGASVLLANTTIADNLNESFGGTAAVVVGTNSALTTSNTIIGRNQPDDVVTGADATATHDHGLVHTDLTAVLGPLALNGGSPAYLTHALLATASPALGIGSSATCQLPVVGGVDARGLGRPADGCDIGAVERDLLVPSASGAALGLAAPRQQSGASVVGRVSWTGGDAPGGSGVRGYRVQRSVDGGPYAQVAFGTAKSFTTALASGRSYRFRVRAEDFDGNVSPWSTTAAYGARLVQQSASSVSWTGTWTKATSTSLSGGTARYASKSGATATLTAKARGYALVATKAPGRGKARVYVDGVLRATVDLGAGSTTYRVQVWSISFTSAKTRTVKVVVLGTSGRPRVDVDAFGLLV